MTVCHMPPANAGKQATVDLSVTTRKSRALFFFTFNPRQETPP